MCVSVSFVFYAFDVFECVVSIFFVWCVLVCVFCVWLDYT